MKSNLMSLIYARHKQKLLVAATVQFNADVLSRALETPICQNPKTGVLFLEKTVSDVFQRFMEKQKAINGSVDCTYTIKHR